MRRPKAVLVVAAGIAGSALIALTAFAVLDGGDAETQESQDAGKLRYKNVLVEQPASSELVMTTSAPPAAGKPWLIHVFPLHAKPNLDDLSSFPELQIDAETGQVLRDNLSAVYPAEVQSILNSITLDSGSSPDWPATDVPPPVSVQRFQGVAYTNPLLSSGFQVAYVWNDCPQTQDQIETGIIPTGCGPTLLVSNTRSQMHVDANNGEVVSWETVSPEDIKAFERFASQVVVLSDGAN